MTTNHDTNLNDYDPIWDDSEILKIIVANRGITTGAIVNRTRMDAMRVKQSVHRLQTQGAISFLGWVAVEPEPVTQGDSEERKPEKKPVTLGDSSVTQGDSSMSNLRVRWKPKTGRPDGPQYAYLYRGETQVRYIGGPRTDPLKQAWVEQIEHWIELNLPVDYIVECIGLLKSGRWKLRRGDAKTV